MTSTLYTANRRAAGARQYAQVGLESQVLRVRPEQLINLLFRGARTAVKKAQFHFEKGAIAQRGALISKAVNIVDSGLKAAVDKEDGDEITEDLITNYDLNAY